MKQVTRTAPVQRTLWAFLVLVKIAGSMLDLSGQDQKGILLNNSFKRYALRVNSEFDVLKNLRIGENIQATYRSVLGQGGAAGGQGVAADENDVFSSFPDAFNHPRL